MINLEVNFRTVFIISAIIVLTLPLNALAQDVSSQLALNEASIPTSAEYTYTENATPKAEKHYSEGQLAYTLMRVGVGTPAQGFHIGGMPPTHSSHPSVHSLDTPRGYEQQYPWLYEYLYRKQGAPRFYAINKWTKPIKVVFGFPNDLKPYADYKGVETQSNLYSFFRTSQKPEVYKFAETVVQPFLKTVEDLTGLPATYIAQEDKDDLGNLRIVFTNGTPMWETPFKLTSSGIMVRPHTPNVLFRGFLERQYMNTAVHFTPGALQQVDGYIIPNADNSIGMTFCYIWEGHSEALMKALIQECMLRSLGLPGETPSKKSSGLLGYWNKGEKKGVADEAQQDISVPITKLERDVIRFLYSDKVKTGMTAMDIYWTFMAKNK